jgi:lipoprotein-releasing system permease protein
VSLARASGYDAAGGLATKEGFRMYKLLLCWRYLLTRYLALACIVSVMLGVATLIVVNSVMGGFSTKLKQRLHGLLSDVVIKSFVADGFADPDEKIKQIERSPLGAKIAAMTASIEILGLVETTYNGQAMPPRPVRLIGIDAPGRARLGGFSEYLLNQKNSPNPSFVLSPEAQRWHDLRYAPSMAPPPVMERPAPGEGPKPVWPIVEEPKRLSGIIMGFSIGNFRERRATAESETKDVPVVRVGDEIVIYTIAGQGLVPVYDNVVVADFFKSEMSEYDSNFVFGPLRWLQNLRGMENRATSIQIALKDYADAPEVVQALEVMFPRERGFNVDTWEDEQGPLLAAIGVEKGILNVLLFLIIGVAGFGILAIFAMIVVEKTRDIGILKSLGASNVGVMNIFLGYGLLLGVVGAALGTVLGLEITIHINEIEHFLTHTTGKEIFPRDVYYFDEIPTYIQGWTVFLVNAGAVAIAVIFSILPALRAALLHPVRALRYE